MKLSMFSAALLILLSPVAANAQRKDGHDVVNMILNTLKTARQMDYTYEMAITFPDGNTQKLKGEVFVNNEAHELYNDNDLQTIIYTGKWSYKATHGDREVVIVNNEKHLNKEYKAEMEKELFQNNTLSLFLDSVVIKHSLVKSYKKHNDTIDVELSFPPSYAIKSINFSYDNARNELIGYSLGTFVPEEDYSGNKKAGTTHHISCSGFTDRDDKQQFRIDNYFVVDNAKVVLKKYGGYKVSAKL